MTLDMTCDINIKILSMEYALLDEAFERRLARLASTLSFQDNLGGALPAPLLSSTVNGVRLRRLSVSSSFRNAETRFG